MDTDNLLLEVVDNRMKDYEETWLKEHRVADFCYQFEEELAGFLELFRFVTTLDARWREDIFSGAKTYPVEMEKWIRSFLQRWLAPASTIDDLIEFFESQQYKE